MDSPREKLSVEDFGLEFLRAHGAARSPYGQVRGLLGRAVCAGRLVRRFSISWLLPIHAWPWHGLLARCHSARLRFWIDSPQKWRRALARFTGRGLHRILLLSDPA